MLAEWTGSDGFIAIKPRKPAPSYGFAALPLFAQGPKCEVLRGRLWEEPEALASGSNLGPESNWRHAPAADMGRPTLK